MASLIDVKEYFKGDDVPQGHPFQTPRKGGESLPLKPNDKLSSEPEETYGYKGKEHKNPHSGDNKIKVDND